MKSIKKHKKGAASFYIVALSTLILVIIATSFATVILSETSRSENDDLSQSAYDSALAGLEDAKVAFSNYRRCVEKGETAADSKPTGGSNVTCNDIIWWMEKDPDSCYTVGRILGKIGKDEEIEVAIGGKEVQTGPNGKVTTTNQAYTCVKIDTDMEDYVATLNSDHMSQVIRAGVKDGGTNTVNKVRISWYSVRNDNKDILKYENFGSNKVTFKALISSTVAVPPTLEVQIVQTAEKFNLSQFDKTDGNRTNRGTVYLVPSKDCTKSETKDGANYIGVASGDCSNKNEVKNEVTATQVVKTNNHHVSNKPFVVYCNDKSTNDFYCSVDIILPWVIKTVEGSTTYDQRANDTFMIGVALPYQKPNTDFKIELICDGDGDCGGEKGGNIDGSSVVKIRNTQISIDSTGRANDLYRRVETRLETSDTAFGYGSPYYALQILSEDSGYTTEKNMTVTYEKDFYF